METWQGLVQAPKGLLIRPTVNRYLAKWHLDQPHLMREPAAVRFQAEHSNDCWQFDITTSDLKRIDKPEWIDPAKGEPTLAIAISGDLTLCPDLTLVQIIPETCVSGAACTTGVKPS